MICSTLRNPKQIKCDFVRSKKGMLRPLRPEFGMLRIWAKQIWDDFPCRGLQFLFRPTRPKKGMFRPSRPRLNKFDRHDPTSCLSFDHFGLRKNFSTKLDQGKNISTKYNQGKTSHVATLRYPKQRCCDFVRPKLTILQLRETQLRYNATLRDPK